MSRWIARIRVPASIFALAALAGTGAAQVPAPTDPPFEGVSPVRKHAVPPGDPLRGGRRRDPGTEPRSLDGSGNNLADPDMNRAETPLYRIAEPDYADGISALAGPTRPSPRVISNAVHDQAGDRANPLGTSDFLWQWGQFLDHDIDLSGAADPPESAPIPVPPDDEFFAPNGAIPFDRSIYDPASGTGPGNPRQQLNQVSGWIDASNVYGSDPMRAEALRTLDGTGRLRTSEGDLLPPNDRGLPNASGGSEEEMFLAGDVRANEQVGLTTLHTLFVREHNRLAGRIANEHPDLSGDEIYERARRLVGALMQVITFREYLPALLGPGALPPYRGYDPNVEARVASEFSIAAYRFGHSALSHRLLRLDADLSEIPEGSLPLRDAFFHPDAIRHHGIEPLLRGLVYQLHQRVDVFVIDDVRNFLFASPQAGGFDLASLNLQRGRDHGLASYNAMRQVFGRAPAIDFADISSDAEVQARLADAYHSVDDVDLWTGGLAEDPSGGGHLGPLFAAIIAEQFTALRDGDRFWYQRVLTGRELGEIEGTRLSDVIRRNTSIGSEIPRDVFHVPPGHRKGARPTGHEPEP